MTETFFTELELELRKGTSKKGHPFRFFTLATIGQGSIARLRTVVLRRVSEDFKLIFYTDRRSKKIEHIKHNSGVSLLFYHPKQLLQLKIEGKAEIVTDSEALQKYWSGIQPASRKDYTTSAAPGSPISNPDTLDYLEHRNYFTIIEVTLSKIEYLKLKRPNHLRILFSKEDGEWDGAFLVP